MLRFHRLLYLCSDFTKFRCSQTILKIVFDYNGKGFLQQIVNNELNKLKGQKNIDSVAVEEVASLLNPTQGLLLPAQLKKGRILLGQNKKQKFPIHLNWLTSCLIKQLYKYDESGQLKSIAVGYRCRYIVGTVGLGKTSFFIACKYLHDLKIKHIIKNPQEKSKIFKDTVKMFYFLSNMVFEDVKLQVVQEVEKDFNLSQEEKEKLFVQTQFDFFRNVRLKYRQKGIDVQYVVDQFNQLYRKQITKDKLSLILDNWNTVANQAVLSMIVLSSKNNQLKGNQGDPLYRVAGALQHILKISIDQYMLNPEVRLLYAYDCLIFDLQRYGLSRQTAFEIAVQIKKWPLTTHLFSADLLESLGKQNLQFTQNNKKQITKEIQKNLRQNLGADSQTLKKNISQLKKEMDQIIPQKFYTKAQSADLLMMMLIFLKDHKKYQITIQLYQKERTVKKTAQITYMKIQDSELIYIIKNSLKNSLPNYFNFQSLSKQIYCTVPSQNLTKIMSIFNFESNIKFIKTLRQSAKSYQQYKKVVEIGGIFFQNQLKRLFPEGQNQKRLIIFHLQRYEKIIFYVLGTSQLQKINHKAQNNPKNTQNFIKNRTNTYVDNIVKGKKLVSAGKNNICFDYFVSNLENNILSILLIDTTIGSRQLQKIQNFDNKLLNNDSFKSILNGCANKQQVNQIRLYCCVLNNQFKSQIQPKYFDISNRGLPEKLKFVVAFNASLHKDSLNIFDDYYFTYLSDHLQKYYEQIQLTKKLMNNKS